MNKINETIFCRIWVLLVAALLAGCGQQSTENKIYGTWEISAFFSNADFGKFSKEPIPEGVEVEMTMKGTQGYHKGGKYSGEAKITLRIRTTDGEIPLRFFVKDAGEWSLHSNGKELVETTTDGTFTPLDELTTNFLKLSPEFSASLKPIKGKTTTTSILSISETIMEVQENESKIKFTLNKKR